MLALPAMAVDELRPPDLTPVTWLEAPKHPPVEIVRDGQARAAVYVSEAAPGAKLKRLLDELVEVVRLGTGATLERVDQPPPADRPAIVIGDCEEARAAGIDATKLPPEGFVVKTAPNRVYLVGSTGNPDGTAWAVADFLERFAGVRWYWPAKAAGRSIPRMASLVVPPAHYSDQPVFHRRIDFIETSLMPLHTEGHNRGDRMPLPLAPGIMQRDETWWYVPGMEALLRHGESLDFTPGIYQGGESVAWWLSRAVPRGMWAHENDIRKAGDAARALNADGTRHERWICFSAPETLDALLARLSRHWDEKAPGWPPHRIMTDTSCTVYFPRTPGLVCHCPRCQETAARLRDDRKLRAALIGDHGERRANEIVEERVHELVFGLFVQRVCKAVKQRWPDKKVVLNGGDHKPPEGVEFPDNLRVASVWPEGFAMGRALHPSTGRAFDKTIRGWGQVLIWASASSPGDWTCGPVQYPHLVRDFYLRNRHCITGTELPIFSAPILVSEAPTYYVWQRVLWNPELDVDATLDEMCRRLFGPGARAARELLRLECDRWEKTPLPRPLHMENLHRDQLPRVQGIGLLAEEQRLPADLFREIWPPDVVARMKKLRDEALAEIDKAGETDARRAFLYWNWTFDAFLEEAETAHRRIPADVVREAARAPLASAEGLPETAALDLVAEKPAPITLTAGRKYYVEVLHKEGEGRDNCAVAWTGPGIEAIMIVAGQYLSPWVAATPKPPPRSKLTGPADGATTVSAALNVTVNPAVAGGTGTILREYWTGIGGGAVSNLTGHADLPDQPTGSDQLTSLETVSWADPGTYRDWADNYGQRVRGYIHPPVSGDYTFYISSDDQSELWLSSDENPANKVKIACESRWSLARKWPTGAKMKLTLIRPGEFMMGSATNTWGHHRNEDPLHRVRITKPFYMGVCEVTRAQYDAVMGSNSAGDSTNRPAASVSWREATNFCGRASAKTGRRVRLPTEAEWEYACRAGTATPWSFGDLDRVDAMKDCAWYDEEARGGPKDVGGKKPNAWGLYDMHGNVSEWCMDRFGADHYLLSPMDNPAGPETGIFRVMRGGSADNLARRNVEFARSARRAWGHPDIRSGGVGFRVVIETD